MDNADGADGGRTGGLRRTGGQADRGRTGGQRRTGGREANGRTGGRGAKERQTGGRGMGRRADGWMRADGARTGRTGDRADGRTSRGFKRPRTSFPASLSSAQTTRLTVEQVYRALGSALGS